MSAISSSTEATARSAFTQGSGNGIEDLDQNQFLQLILTELQNQDPLAPTDNAALLEQMSNLRSITANDSLMNTLNSFGVTQELTTASNLIGRTINAIDTSGNNVKGKVSSVSVETDEKDRNKRDIRVHVGNQTVDIKNIREIVPAE